MPKEKFYKECKDATNNILYLKSEKHADIALLEKLFETEYKTFKNAQKNTFNAPTIAAINAYAKIKAFEVELQENVAQYAKILAKLSICLYDEWLLPENVQSDCAPIRLQLSPSVFDGLINSLPEYYLSGRLDKEKKELTGLQVFVGIDESGKPFVFSRIDDNGDYSVGFEYANTHYSDLVAHLFDYSEYSDFLALFSRAQPAGAKMEFSDCSGVTQPEFGFYFNLTFFV